MPSNIVKSFSDKTGKSEEEVERLWKKAQGLAIDNDIDKDSESFYPYVVGILKRMLKIEDDELDEEPSITTSTVGGSAQSHLFHKKVGNKKDDEEAKKKMKKFLDRLEKNINKNA